MKNGVLSCPFNVMNCVLSCPFKVMNCVLLCAFNNIMNCVLSCPVNVMNYVLSCPFNIVYTILLVALVAFSPGRGLSGTVSKQLGALRPVNRYSYIRERTEW